VFTEINNSKKDPCTSQKLPLCIVLVFCWGGETGLDMSHLEDRRELENLSVSKQPLHGEAVVRETCRAFTKVGKYK